jgi:isoleucyl-tRNA synthetase
MSETARREEKTLAHWKQHRIFEKTLEKNAPRGEFIFFDGPPFASGTPHYGHILAGSIKDVIPRYKTMCGFRVPRRWGWDCHGLPIENLVEKELGLKSKKDIEQFGIQKFNETAREVVLRYAGVWREQVPRFGRFVDMENDYRTMDIEYTKSVWWVFKTLFDKGLVYEGFKSMHLCPRCGTTLSNFEVNQGYKDITDISVYVKFALVDEPQTFIIAWTTTPWTLPGNVALAVNSEIDYAEVELVGSSEKYIVAQARVETLFKKDFKILKTYKGLALTGKKYAPVFDYYAQDSNLKNRENGWKIYAADFVTTDDGTGVVHIAPGYGEDDYQLGVKHSLPFIQHVGVDGRFKPEVRDFVGLYVKPKGDAGEKDPHQKTDVEVIKWLHMHGALFAKEKLVHSYPHCWRCETPLLNYAASSWFVKVTSFKDELVAANKDVRWVPSHVGEGRFGKWLQGARDWAISRTRYWGAPLPVWKSEDGTEVKVLSTVEDIVAHSKVRNTLYLMRHGQAESNLQNKVSTDPNAPDHLTPEGVAQVRLSAQKLKGKHIDVVAVSPFVRTQETFKEVQDVLGLSDAHIVVDPRLGELGARALHGKNWEEFHAQFPHRKQAFTYTLPDMENLTAVRARMVAAVEDISEKFFGKNVLIIAHGTPLRVLQSHFLGHVTDELVAPFGNAEVREVLSVKLPRNPSYEIDFHRPYIDGLEILDSKGKLMTRVPDVFDCWFESGSMPYGEACFTGTPTMAFDPAQGKGFPADFIAEGLDQTRGWFYALLVLGTALFGRSPFKNVIVNGLVLAEDGKKMSKSLKNYPDPLEVIRAYSMDALRLVLLGSPVVSAEDLHFSEKSVAEVQNKVLNRLENVLTLYKLYADETISAQAHTTHILDRWMIERLRGAHAAITHALESYTLDVGVRELTTLVDDVSTWYTRRSRERFKSDDVEDRREALETTRFVLHAIAKLLAPYAPFFAETLAFEIGRGSESIHLEEWDSVTSHDQALLDGMKSLREVITNALKLRQQAGVNVRQPLESFTIPKGVFGEYTQEFKDILKAELNVEEIHEGTEYALETKLTPELKAKGVVREFIRLVQDARKENNFSIRDQVTLKAVVPAEVHTLLQATEIRQQIQKVTLVTALEVEEGKMENLEESELKFGR